MTIQFTDAELKLAMRRRQSHMSWDDIAAEIGGVLTGETLKAAISERRRDDARKRRARYADARQALADAVRIGRRTRSRSRAAKISQAISPLRPVQRDPLDNLQHPLVFGETKEGLQK